MVGDGVAKAQSERPDLILMDIQLPVLDGYEATRQIKADPNLKATPIIAVSSFAMKGDEEKARAAGCDHYVTKPYSPLQLLAHHPRLSRRAGVEISNSPVYGSAYMAGLLSSAVIGLLLPFRPSYSFFGLENAHSFVPALTFSRARASKIRQ